FDTRELTVDSLEAFNVGQPFRGTEMAEDGGTQLGQTKPRYLQVSPAKTSPLRQWLTKLICARKQHTVGSTLSVDSLGQQLAIPDTKVDARREDKMLATDSIDHKPFQYSVQSDSLSEFPAAERD